MRMSRASHTVTVLNGCPEPSGNGVVPKGSGIAIGGGSVGLLRAIRWCARFVLRLLPGRARTVIVDGSSRV